MISKSVLPCGYCWNCQWPIVYYHQQNCCWWQKSDDQCAGDNKKGKIPWPKDSTLWTYQPAFEQWILILIFLFPSYCFCYCWCCWQPLHHRACQQPQPLDQNLRITQPHNTQRHKSLKLWYKFNKKLKELFKLNYKVLIFLLWFCKLSLKSNSKTNKQHKTILFWSTKSYQ